MIELEPYSDADLWLLERNNAPEMTEHLGGPESAEQIRRRHQRYIDIPSAGTGLMFKIALRPESDLNSSSASGSNFSGVGLIGYWEKIWRDELVWEAGWGVLPEYQGRGIAKAALIALVTKAKQASRHRFMHAFPSIDNPPSNALCRSVGFEWIEACNFEYPRDHFMRCNDWRLDLMPER